MTKPQSLNAVGAIASYVVNGFQLEDLIAQVFFQMVLVRFVNNSDVVIVNTSPTFIVIG